MKKIRLSTKAVLSLVLSAVLFCMPAVGFALNGNYALDVHAEDSKEQEAASEEHTESTGQTGDNREQESSSGIETENGTEESSESTTEESTESGTVSGNEAAEPVCTCEDKCSAYSFDRTCEVCAEDYKLCEYKKPNVTININKPEGWFNDSATVTFTVSDVAHTGNFEIAMIQAKVGQNGSWTDVTEDRKLTVSENCTVYVLVTDQKGNTYERNRAIKCFDTTKPTLNAAVSDGLLSVQVHDTDSGAKAVYVNGYEFTDLTNGTLNIRLQQFDAGYEYFTISAMDNAGNMSFSFGCCPGLLFDNTVQLIVEALVARLLFVQCLIELASLSAQFPDKGIGFTAGFYEFAFLYFEFRQGCGESTAHGVEFVLTDFKYFYSFVQVGGFLCLPVAEFAEISHTSAGLGERT